MHPFFEYRLTCCPNKGHPHSTFEDVQISTAERAAFLEPKAKFRIPAPPSPFLSTSASPVICLPNSNKWSLNLTKLRVLNTSHHLKPLISDGCVAIPSLGCLGCPQSQQAYAAWRANAGNLSCHTQSASLPRGFSSGWTHHELLFLFFGYQMRPARCVEHFLYYRIILPRCLKGDTRLWSDLNSISPGNNCRRGMVNTGFRMGYIHIQAVSPREQE